MQASITFYKKQKGSFMKLIFIYGPPAVGKLTVAKKLAQLTGYTVFHLHQTIDLVTQFFPQGTAAYSHVTRIIRLAIIERLYS